VTIFAIFGGATIKVREKEDVMLSSASFFGGRSMELSIRSARAPAGIISKKTGSPESV
jgi:hypothetical protein